MKRRILDVVRRAARVVVVVVVVVVAALPNATPWNFFIIVFSHRRPQACENTELIYVRYHVDYSMYSI